MYVSIPFMQVTQFDLPGYITMLSRFNNIMVATYIPYILRENF